MKVIFLQDVPNVAKAGEAREVADGYGRNYLIPKKLAVPASPRGLEAVKAELEKRARTEARTETEMRELAARLEGKELTIVAKTGGKERLYGSITAADIADELEKSGLVVDRRKIEVADSIRQLGTYDVAVKLAKDISANIKVTVAEEETGDQRKTATP
jgi:large subunit ribosomal protein L9